MAETDTGFMSCELKLDTNTAGWHKTMTKVLKNIKGVSYTIDAQAGIARVSGKIDPDTLMKLLAKSGKHAELLRVDSGYKEQFYTAEQAAALSYGGGHYHKRHYLHGRGYGYGDGYYNNSHYGHYPPSVAYPLPDPYHSGQYHDSYYEPHRYPSAPHVGFPQPPPPTVVHPFYDPDTQCTIM